MADVDDPAPWLPEEIWTAALHDRPLHPEVTLYAAFDPAGGEDAEVVIVAQLPCGRVVFL